MSRLFRWEKDKAKDKPGQNDPEAAQPAVITITRNARSSNRSLLYLFTGTIGNQGIWTICR